jgi:hypothetical protein
MPYRTEFNLERVLLSSGRRSFRALVLALLVCLLGGNLSAQWQYVWLLPPAPSSSEEEPEGPEKDSHEQATVQTSRQPCRTRSQLPSTRDPRSNPTAGTEAHALRAARARAGAVHLTTLPLFPPLRC